MVPLSSLRSHTSFGIGDFYDLEKFGTWANEVNLEMIQLLPLQDSGDFFSPYSALSANALSHVYLVLSWLPGFEKIEKEVSQSAHSFAQNTHVHFSAVYRKKMELAYHLYEKGEYKKAELTLFEKEHEYWLLPFAVFKVLKEQNNSLPWYQWPDFQNPTFDLLNEIKEKYSKRYWFIIYLQFFLQHQFIKARQSLKKMGVQLKGDIPILMNKDSADVWYYRDFFSIDYSAGSPPDMFTSHGQNWGFPIYNWEKMEKDNFRWWKERIKSFSYFYDAYRIDHVLGFLRIWRIPLYEESGVMGHFFPLHKIEKNELMNLGFDAARIRWLSQPHIVGKDIRHAFTDEEATQIFSYLEQINNEDLYLFSKKIKGESSIRALPLNDKQIDFMLKYYWNRSLVPLEDSGFAPCWFMKESRSWKSLNDHERNELERLLEKKEVQNEALWEKEGEKLLSVLKKSSLMLVCAEDLGTIPACLGPLLNRLEILSLKVWRWARNYDTGDLFLPNKYPYLSVATPSVHDTSTMRGWWEEETDKKIFLEQVKKEVKPNSQYDKEFIDSENKSLSPQLAKFFLQNLSSANSMLVVIPLQDLFAISEKMRVQTPSQERINIPGSVNDTNWTWQMPFSIEELMQMKDWNLSVKSLADRNAK